MKGEKKTGDLLSELAEALGFDCLSDLHFMEDTMRLSLAVANISPDKYDSKEWYDAVSYIESTTNQPNNKQFSSAEEAREYLLKAKRQLF